MCRLFVSGHFFVISCTHRRSSVYMGCFANIDGSGGILRIGTYSISSATGVRAFPSNTFGQLPLRVAGKVISVVHATTGYCWRTLIHTIPPTRTREDGPGRRGQGFVKSTRSLCLDTCDSHSRHRPRHIPPFDPPSWPFPSAILLEDQAGSSELDGAGHPRQVTRPPEGDITTLIGSCVEIARLNSAIRVGCL